jgi:hypothetical protein
VTVRLVHGGGWRSRAAAVAVLVAATTAGGAFLGTAPASAGTTIKVDPGYGGAFTAGEPVPVRVSISADRLIRATLQVVVGAGTPVDVGVEVPGGSEKQFVVVAPTAFEASPVATARLHQDALVISADAPLRAGGDQELVGLLPGVLRGRTVPGPAPLAVDAVTARFAALGEAELLQAPGSLGPLSTLGMDTGELAGLAPEARAGVLSWVEHGGRLLVDAERGRSVPGLPDGWQPGARGRASAGLGEVVATAGAMAAGRWANLVEPVGPVSTVAAMGGGAATASSLASEAGLRSPRLGWLVGFLAVYVVVAGPVLFYVVRRRRRPELAWVALPLVAILFSTGSYVVGRGGRTATQLVHGTVLMSGTAGATATSYFGVFSRSGETATVGLPAGWSSVSLGRDVVGPAGLSGASLTSGGLDARVPLDAGQFGVLAATGPASAAGGLELSASAGAGGRVTGTVRNTSRFMLDDVAVLAGTDGARVGQLAPGQIRDWTIANPAVAGRQNPEFGMWGNRPNGDGPDLSLWEAAIQAQNPSFRALGSVVAAGWTRDYVPAVRLDGRVRRPGGHTVVVARAPVAPGAPADPIDAAIRQDVVRDPFAANVGASAPGRASVVRFVLPDGVPASGLVLRSPFGSAELWQDGAWRPAACSDAVCAAVAGKTGGACCAIISGPVCPPNVPCPVAPQVTIAQPPGIVGAALAVPESAVHDGVVYARVQGPASVSQGFQLSLGRAQ